MSVRGIGGVGERGPEVEPADRDASTDAAAGAAARRADREARPEPGTAAGRRGQRAGRASGADAFAEKLGRLLAAGKKEEFMQGLHEQVFGLISRIEDEGPVRAGAAIGKANDLLGALARKGLLEKLPGVLHEVVGPPRGEAGMAYMLIMWARPFGTPEVKDALRAGLRQVPDLKDLRKWFERSVPPLEADHVVAQARKVLRQEGGYGVASLLGAAVDAVSRGFVRGKNEDEPVRFDARASKDQFDATFAGLDRAGLLKSLVARLKTQPREGEFDPDFSRDFASIDAAVKRFGSPSTKDAWARANAG